MQIHELKIDETAFQGVVDGRKHHEVRKFDRPFKVGDVLHLREYSRHSKYYSGRATLAQITWITPPGHYGLPIDVGVLSITLDIQPRRPHVRNEKWLAERRQDDDYLRTPDHIQRGQTP